MSEPLSDHEIERIRGTGVGPGAQRVLGHDLGYRDISRPRANPNHAESQVLGGEDTGNPVLLVGYQNTILTLGGHHLSGFRDGGVGFDL